MVHRIYHTNSLTSRSPIFWFHKQVQEYMNGILISHKLFPLTLISIRPTIDKLRKPQALMISLALRAPLRPRIVQQYPNILPKFILHLLRESTFFHFFNFPFFFSIFNPIPLFLGLPSYSVHKPKEELSKGRFRNISLMHTGESPSTST